MAFRDCNYLQLKISSGKAAQEWILRISDESNALQGIEEIEDKNIFQFLARSVTQILMTRKVILEFGSSIDNYLYEAKRGSRFMLIDLPMARLQSDLTQVLL